MKTLILSITILISYMLGTIGYKSVNVNEFSELIKTEKNLIILDTRTEKEFKDGHIKGSICIDVLKEDFEQQALNKLDKNKTIAVYCRSGRRSKKAAEILSKKGYTVVELDCGIICWVSTGREIVK